MQSLIQRRRGIVFRLHDLRAEEGELSLDSMTYARWCCTHGAVSTGGAACTVCAHGRVWEGAACSSPLRVRSGSHAHKPTSLDASGYSP